jgi:hypothetical protein
LIQIGIFAGRTDMSGRIIGQLRKTLLESGEEARHVQCPKPDSPVWKTGYSGFDRTDTVDLEEEF